MATFFQSVRQGFGRGSNRNNNNQQQQQQQPPRPANGAAVQGSGYAPNSPGFPHTNMSAPPMPAAADVAQPKPEPIKYFFQEKYAQLNVKGNFLTLAACPKNVELGEWIAHQVVEQYRLLKALLEVIQETNGVTGMPICNEKTCPTMSVGHLTFDWLIDDKPAKISAPKFINRVERWIVSKIHDPVMFPTSPLAKAPATSTLTALAAATGTTEPVDPQDWIGKSSGFPPTFYKDCQGMMKQMFRCYGHLYHSHWEDPFWHINKTEILNMCFVHFVTVAKYFKLVADKDFEPMQPLIDIFTRLEKIPQEAESGHWAQNPTPAPASATA